MDLGLLGVYWGARALTLHGYSDFVRNVLELLRTSHAVFDDLHWVGDGKRKPMALPDDMSNLDELILQHSWGNRYLIGDVNPDGTPSWSSQSLTGFQMIFNTGRSAKQGGLTVSVHAGDYGSPTPNVITICFPPPGSSTFVHRDFYDYTLMLDLFAKILRLAMPESGLVSSQDFSNAIFSSGPYDIGWLTYFSDSRCKDLTNQFSTEDCGVDGTLFTLGKESMFMNSEETVALGRRLRGALKQLNVL